LIWAIPPLSPPSDLPDRNDPTHITPLLKIPFPDGIIRHTPEIHEWMRISSWHFGSWESFYFDIFYTDSKLQRFKIIIKPNLSDASLQVINTSDIISDDIMTSLKAFRICDGYRICEDALVYFWNNRFEKWGTYTGLMSAPLTNVVTRWNGSIDSLCPASGRFAYFADDDDGERIVVVDLF
jgi:hypothetical protein